MKIFITGATGVLGRRTVAGLVGRGHAVAGLSRSDANDELLRKLGAEPRRGDLFDAASLRRAGADCDTILHLATKIPSGSKASRSDWEENDRIRTAGTQAILNAVDPAEHKYVVLQSVSFLYGDRQGAQVDETTAVAADLMSAVVSAGAMERIMFDALGKGWVTGRILRFGRFYSADSPTTSGVVQMIRRGRFPLIGDGAWYWNLIHVDDAAAAVVQAVERRGQEEQVVLNINDDEPVRLGDLIAFIAAETGGREPKRIAPWLARLLLGGDVYRFLTESSRIANGRAKAILDWAPRYADYRTGFREVLTAGK